jgi:hypothetical protein
VRIEVRRSDNLADIPTADCELVSAYVSPDLRPLVVVAINWRD